jgi:hypothetical protein
MPVLLDASAQRVVGLVSVNSKLMRKNGQKNIPASAACAALFGAAIQ